MVAGVRRSDSAGHTFCCRLAKAMVMHEHGPGLQNGCLEHGRSGRSSIRVSRAVSATWSGKVLEVSALRVAPARQGIAGRSGARASRRGPGRGPDHRAAIPAHSTLRDSRTLRATWLSRSVGTARVDLRTCRSSERNAESAQVWALSLFPACRIFRIVQARPRMPRFHCFSGHRVACGGRVTLPSGRGRAQSPESIRDREIAQSTAPRPCGVPDCRCHHSPGC